MKGIVKFLIFIVIAAAAWYGWVKWQDTKGLQVEYTAAPVGRDNILITIDATGTLRPYDLVDIGAQVGGRIVEFGEDVNGKEVDYSSEVKKGDLLAKIDDLLINSDIARAEAAVEQSKASILKAKADIIQSQAKHEQAKRNRERAEKLGPGEALAQATYDQYIADEEMARAAVTAAEAALKQAEATLISNEENLTKERRNKEYTVITSPIDGVVVRRLVSFGQTVVASMNAPSLFLIGTDLKTMKIWSAVNEADIGSIYPGQKVVYKTDAYPELQFEGVVEKIRLDATMASNVVTYVVEIVTENPDYILIPFLTADVKFIVQDIPDTLVVPNSATRYQPDEDMVLPSELESFRKKYQEVFSEAQPAGRSAEKKMVLWVQEGHYVRPVWVTGGESNGTVTPVRPDEGYTLNEGDMIVIGSSRLDRKPGDEANASKNPFMPNMSRRGRR